MGPEQPFKADDAANEKSPLQPSETPTEFNTLKLPIWPAILRPAAFVGGGLQILSTLCQAPERNSGSGVDSRAPRDSLNTEVHNNETAAALDLAEMMMEYKLWESASPLLEAVIAAHDKKAELSCRDMRRALDNLATCYLGAGQDTMCLDVMKRLRQAVDQATDVERTEIFTLVYKEGTINYVVGDKMTALAKFGEFLELEGEMMSHPYYELLYKKMLEDVREWRSAIQREMV